VIHVKAPGGRDITTKLYIPASRTFCVSQPIPFHLTFSSSSFVLASFLPFGPTVRVVSTKQPTRVQLIRQSTVNVRWELFVPVIYSYLLAIQGTLSFWVLKRTYGRLTLSVKGRSNTLCVLDVSALLGCEVNGVHSMMDQTGFLSLARSSSTTRLKCLDFKLAG